MNSTNIPTKEQLRDRFSQELGLEKLSTQEQESIVTELSKVILERIIMELMLVLPETEAREVDTLVTRGGSESEITKIINTHIPDSSEIIEQVVIRALAEFKALTSNHA